jgi:hypothetical protein
MLTLAKLIKLRNDVGATYSEYINYKEEGSTVATNRMLPLIQGHQNHCIKLSMPNELDHKRLEHSHLKIIDLANQYCQQVNQFTDQLDKEIKAEQKLMLSREGYLELNEYSDVSAQISSRFTQLSEVIKDTLTKHINWKYPGLLFRPMNSACVNLMVGVDPLYLVDVDQKYLTSTVEQFEPAYQNRLRLYSVDDRTDKPILSQLPQAQFGCIAEHNFFTYKSYETVCRYLTEVFDLLRPGGTFIFTLVDGDTVSGLELVERCKSTYLPGHMIRQKARDLTYRIVQYTVSNGIAVVELQKPGELSSIRGGQTLARIVPN